MLTFQPRNSVIYNKSPNGNLVFTKKIQLGQRLRPGTEVSLKNSWGWRGEEKWVQLRRG